jgi:hypothetical protein
VSDQNAPEKRRSVLMACFPDADRAEAGLKDFMEPGFPLERTSLLGRASASPGGSTC